MHPLTADYLSGKPELEPYYEWPLSMEGISQAIAERKNFKVDRRLLTKKLSEKYQALVPGFDNSESFDPVRQNLKSLESENTFTITTGHQLSLFTGPLYFIYKILSAVKYAAQL